MIFFLLETSFFVTLLLPYLIALGNLFLIFLFLPMTKWVLDYFTPFDDDKELTEKDNVAFSLTRAGEYVSVILIIAGSLYGSSFHETPYTEEESSPKYVPMTLEELPTPPDSDPSTPSTKTIIPLQPPSEEESNPLKAILEDYFENFLWAGIGLVLLLLTKYYFLERLLFPYFSITKEVVNDQNAGAGALEASALISIGILIACAISGENQTQTQLTLQLFHVDAKLVEFLEKREIPEVLHEKFKQAGSPLSSEAVLYVLLKESAWKIQDSKTKQSYLLQRSGEIVQIRYFSKWLNHPFLLDFLSAILFWICGCLMLWLFSRCYEKTLGYSLHHEIEKDNISAGVSYAFNLLAISLIVAKSIAGDFISLTVSIEKFFFHSLLGFVVLLFFRVLIDRILLSDRRIAQEITEDQNLSVSFLEGFIYLGIALVLFLSL